MTEVAENQIKLENKVAEAPSGQTRNQSTGSQRFEGLMNSKDGVQVDTKPDIGVVLAVNKMAQQTLTNGPTADANHLKTENSNQESQPAKLSSEPPVTSSSPQPSGPFLIRPPLNRADSRQNSQYRPPFSTTNPPPVLPGGPQQIGSTNSQQQHQLNPQVLSGHQLTSPVNSGPHSIGPHILSGQQQLRHQQPAPAVIRPPVPTQSFVQRGPPLGPGGTSAPRTPASVAPFAQNQPQHQQQQQQQQQQRPVFRPQGPFPRPPLLGQRPQIFQQSSVPAFNRPRATVEDSFNRSQTLDSAELEDLKNADRSRNPSVDQRPPSAASLGRSFSVTTSNPTLERKLTGSQESITISRQNSVENVHRKEEIVPSRPDSRSGSRMGKIIESQDNIDRNRPEIRDAPLGEITNGDGLTRSPVKEPPSQIINNFSPKKETLQESLKKRESHQEELKKRDSLQEELKKRELDLKIVKHHKGDNDSGVDESTQGNDQSCNGDSRSPRKPNKSRTSSTTPTTGRSVSRGSKTPSSLQSPESAATTPGSAEKKKVPMNKIQVGSAPSPNLKVVKSKIGSLDNAHYKPGGGKVKIESKKLDFKNAGPKIEAKNEKYVPKVGEKKVKEVYSARSATSSTSPRKIVTQKLEWNAKSKIGSLENANHKPKGGDKKIESLKLNFKDKAAPKVGSKDNIKYQPGGGDVKIENKKIELHVNSKIGSLDNVKHKPTGGDKKIFDDKEYLKQHTKSGKSSMDQSLSGSQHSVQSQEPKAPVADENLNQEH